MESVFVQVRWVNAHI